MKPLLALSAAAAVLAACASTSSSGPDDLGAPGERVASSTPRNQSPDTTAEELAQLTSDNAAFGWRLFREVREDGENLFFSPHSISVALAMTFAGARGNTETEMVDALAFSLGQERLHLAFNQLDLTLATRAEAGDPDAPRPFRLHVTNALFGQVDFAFLDPFLDTLASNYGAGLRLMDFSTEPEASRLAINAWVSDQTERRIDELLPSGIITGDTRLVLVNAIYFTASWADPFDEAATTDDPFTLPDGEEVVVPTMHQVVDTGYVSGPSYEAAELVYDGGQLAMLLIVPNEGELATIENTVSASFVSEIREALTEHSVDLALPKFTFRSQLMAKEALTRLGMVEPFTAGAADFSGMTGNRNLFIQDVVHEGFVAVDEEGTEAAAATAVVIDLDSAPPPAELIVDRPFLFAIIDRPTGATLFIGRVVDPS